MRKLVILFVIFVSCSWGFLWAGGKDLYIDRRKEMIEKQIIARGVKDKDVLDAMTKVARHLFVDESLRDHAYDDSPLPIGEGQTISQPFIVAYMSEVAKLEKEHKVLEIGTGSGYQAAILAEIVSEVYTIEILKSLADKAKETLEGLGYANIFFKHGDGYKGWNEHAPFDAIIVTAAPSKIPQELVKQLKVDGRMIIPVGSFSQELYVITKTETGIDKKSLIPVRFVPMVEGKK